MRAILIFEDDQIPSEEFDTANVSSEDVEDYGLYGAIKVHLNKISRTSTIAKVLIAQNTPNAKRKAYTSAKFGCIPAKMILAETNKLQYNGVKRETDIPAKIRSLMNSDTTTEVVDGCIEAYEEIQTLMDAINKSFKENMPFNAERQGFIRHHFPSPVFLKTEKEMTSN